MNPYHDELGRFASGPGAGRMEGASRLKAHAARNLRAAGEKALARGENVYDPRGGNRGAGSGLKISGRGSKSIDVTKQFASGKSPFSLVTHIGNKPVSPVREKIDGKWRNIK